jgi:hypothetical protein
MPLKLNVGASRKVTDNNYGSRGASVNLEMELDTNLVSDPPKLQEKIRHLFQVARTALAEELNGGSHRGNGHAGPSGNGDQPLGDRPPANGNGVHRGSRDTGPRRSTTSQCKALHAIARAHGVNLGDYLRSHYQAQRPEDLSIRQASEAIDDLKATGVGAEAGS